MTRIQSRCPVPGCERTKQSGHMMCREDWRRVTKPTQAKVYATWRRVNSASFPVADEEGAADRAWADYFAIREQAIREAEA